MKFPILIFGLILFSGFGSADAFQARTGGAPAGGAGGSLGYTCTNNEGQSPSCSCVGVDDCRALSNSGLCELQENTNVPDLECTSGIRTCSCDWNQLEGDTSGWRQDAFSPGTNMAPAESSPSPVEARGNEVVPARRGTPRTVERITDGTSNTPSGPDNSLTAPSNRGTGLSPDAARALRQEALAAQSNNAENRGNEVVRARRGRFSAPSDLQLDDVQRTSLTLRWMDNTAFEHGVAVERGRPTVERGGINYNWQHVFNVEERVTSRADGTGWRSDTDDGLTPGTAYCYRLRAYRGDIFSDYSNPVCIQTEQ
jgi:hypothetical protein